MAKKKVTTVKWALGGDEPEDLQDFLSNDDIVLKNTNRKTKDVLWPKKGPHVFAVKRLMVKPNRNGDPRISAMLVMQNPKKSDASDWNGYLVWDGFNVNEQGNPFLKRFLRALGLEWKDFLNKTKAVEEDNERQQIVQIGRIKFGEDATKDPTIKAIVKVKPADDYNDDEHMEIQRYLPVADDDEDDEPEDDDEDDEEAAEAFDDDSDEEEDDDDEADDEDEEEDDEEEEDEDEDEDEEEDDEAEELREELQSMKIADLKKRLMRRLKKDKVDPDDIDIPTKKAALVDFMVQVEMGEPPF
jgi:hypothetical protein